MKEEQLTKALLKWLITKEWNIICFDYPQSGTGKILHPVGRNEEKNKGAIIPDIVAVKNEVCVFFENKDRFYLADFEKQHFMKTSDDYSESIKSLLKGYSYNTIYYGIGLPTTKYKKNAINAAYLVDFILCIDADETVHSVYNPLDIPF